MTAATPPRQRAMSPKLSEAALTATRTWPTPGSGASTSSTETAARPVGRWDHPRSSRQRVFRGPRRIVRWRSEAGKRRETRRGGQLRGPPGTGARPSGGGGLAGLEDLLVVQRLAAEPAARLVTRLIPSTSMPASRAAIASSVVLMPTSWPPRTPAIRTSAGVS